MLVTAVLIALEDGAPDLLQPGPRRAQGGRLFKVTKFRSMRK